MPSGKIDIYITSAMRKSLPFAEKFDSGDNVMKAKKLVCATFLGFCVT